MIVRRAAIMVVGVCLSGTLISGCGSRDKSIETGDFSNISYSYEGSENSRTIKRNVSIRLNSYISFRDRGFYLYVENIGAETIYLESDDVFAFRRKDGGMVGALEGNRLRVEAGSWGQVRWEFPAGISLEEISHCEVKKRMEDGLATMFAIILPENSNSTMEKARESLLSERGYLPFIIRAYLDYLGNDPIASLANTERDDLAVELFVSLAKSGDITSNDFNPLLLEVAVYLRSYARLSKPELDLLATVRKQYGKELNAVFVDEYCRGNAAGLEPRFVIDILRYESLDVDPLLIHAVRRLKEFESDMKDVVVLEKAIDISTSARSEADDKERMVKEKQKSGKYPYSNAEKYGLNAGKRHIDEMLGFK